MKYSFLLLFFNLSIFASQAQTLEFPLNADKEEKAAWKMKVQKVATDQFEITANLNLAEGWHVFDFEPGGDGMLIAPEFLFESNSVERIKQYADGKLIKEDLKGIGEVRYYKNQVSFKALIRSKDKVISGSIYYQLCDDEKCMAPTEANFTFTVK